MTTVTINDELSRKLKRLAAKYDTNQADIINRSVELFEKYENGQLIPSLINKKENSNEAEIFDQDSNFNEELNRITREYEQKYPKIAKHYQKLRKDPKILDQITIKKWESST